MKRRFGVGLGICALVAAISLGVVPPTPAQAEGPAPTVGLMDAGAAMREALRTGETVVASALTDEHTLVTANPETGLMTANLSAAIARVEDGAGGWREPSTTLVKGADGRWRPEAAAADVTVSGGGDTELATLADGAAKVGFDWPTNLPAPTVDGNLATYSEVAPGVDVVARAALDGVETFIVVKTPEAAQSPLVQSVPIAASAPGMTATTEGNGDVSLADASGEDRLLLPKAYAWDSAGQDDDANLHELIEMAEGSEVVPLDAQVESDSAGASADLSLAADLLSDPDTVFPVVIDPSAHRSKTHALRVTQTFHKYDSDVGSTAKVGYNGWKSPYYKSRMFYQFSWPVNDDGSLVRPNQIATAKFKYKQTYSPQSSCSNTSFGPSVKVQPSAVISGDVDWDDQPGLHSGSESSSDDYAVGQDCGSHTQEWNITAMLRNERADYATRTTVTLRVSSADETERNGWREYANSSASPDLEVVYQGEPQAPTGFSIVGAVSVSPLVANQASLSASAQLNVEAKYACSGTTACLKAELTVLKDDGKGVYRVYRPAVLSGSAVTSGERISLSINDLPDGNYVARLRSYQSALSLYSDRADFPFKVDLPPGKPQWSWVIPDGWANSPDLPMDTSLQVVVSANAKDGDIAAFCTRVNANETKTESCVDVKNIQNGRITVGRFERGSVQVSVAAKDAHTVGDFQLDDPVERTISW